MRKLIDCGPERLSADCDVIGVNLLAIVADQSLRYGAWHSSLVQKRCRRPAQTMERQGIDSPSSAMSDTTIAMVPGRRIGSQTSLNQEVAERY